MEEKYKYYFKHYESGNGDLDFSIPISQFEEILQEFLAKYSTLVSIKNGHKLYGINNKFFKIFQDGSCYGYIITADSFQKIDNYMEVKQTTQQIYNDDFSGFKKYWVEELYEEIVFKCTEEIQIIFSKMEDIPRNYTQYSIYFESKKRQPILTDHLLFIQAKLKHSFQ
jgi:hypothetical protein